MSKPLFKNDDLILRDENANVIVDFNPTVIR